jgi:hypothetical protein
MKVFAWYKDLNGVGNENYHQKPIPYWYQKMWNPHYRYLNGINRR